MNRLHERMRLHVERKNAPGIVTAIHRHGEIDVNAIGSMSFDGKPMQRDTIFRVASLTKLITAATALSMMEDATIHIDAPVTIWLPELADRRVMRDPGGSIDDTVPAKSPITVRQLLTFTCGIGLVFDPRAPINLAIAERDLHFGPPHPSKMPAPGEWMRRLGELPLLHQPGEGWHYSAGADILGVLLARAAVKPLEALMRERIFEPLGMKDTAFHCPVEKADRFPTGYVGVEEDKPIRVLDSATNGEWNHPPAFPGGAAGLVSTADDLLVFAKMLKAHGVHGKERILAKSSVLAMASDQLTAAQKAKAQFFPGFFDSRSWGLGAAVVTKRAGIDANPGTFGWDGGWGTSLWIDPSEDLIGILLTQRAAPPSASAIYRDFWSLVYSSL